MMDDLQNKIAAVLEGLPCRAERGSELDGLRRREAARAILALPEIAEALEALKAWQDAAFLGTGFMKDGKRVGPTDVYIKPPEPGPNEMYSHDVGKAQSRSAKE